MAIPKYKDPITGKWNRITTSGQSGNAVEIAEISGETALSDDIITELKNDLNWISYGGGAYRFVSAEEDKRLYSYITEDKISQILVNTLTKTCALRETQITAASVADSIVKRDSYGEIPVSTPSRDSSATNKAYVDEVDKDLRLKLSNLEQALNGYILDTTEEAYADLDSAVLKNSVAVGDNVYPIADKTRALVTRIEGKTTKMVQLLKNGDFSQGTDNWSKFSAAVKNISFEVVDNSLEVTALTGGTGGDIYMVTQQGMQPSVVGHKYLILVTAKIVQGEGITGFSYEGYTTFTRLVKIDNTNLYYAFITATTAGDWYGLKPFGTKAVGDKWSFSNCQCFDLTAMNREDITTVEQFKAEFPDFYPYENGNIYPAKISGGKFTGKNLFNPSTPKYSGVSSFVLNGDEIVVSQTATATSTSTYVSANFELPNAKFLIGKKISISAKCKTSDNNQGRLRVIWMRGNAAIITSGMNIISNGALGKTETNISASGIVLDPSDDALKLCLLLYSNANGNLSETKTYTATYSNIQVEISDAPTAYEPYTEPVSVTLPETYELHGIGDFKDYLEITKNENNELYTLKKIQQIENKVLNGTETVNKSGYVTTNYQSYYISMILLNVNNGLGGICNKLPTARYTEDIAHITFGINNTYPYLFLDKETYTTEDSVKAYLAAQYAANDPLIIYYIRQTPVETVIATNLTYEQVTAIRHNGGLIEVVGNTNKAYAKPTIKNTVVYRLTATNKAEG